MHNKLLCTLVSCGCLLYFSTANAIEKPQQSYSLHRDSVAANIDGVLDEPVWQLATKVSLDYENDPGEGVPAPVKTNVYLYEDGVNLYVAFEAFDPHPENIRASLRARDNINIDDNVGIILDTFNDKRNGFGFFANAIGAQADKTIVDKDGMQEDDSWDAIWDSAGKINQQGYVVEFSIPFRALRFAHVTEATRWNIGLYRNYPRDNWTQISDVALNRNLSCTLCQFAGYQGFANIEPGNNLQLTPTLTLGRTDVRDVVEPNPWQQGDIEQDVGLDVRWGITKSAVVNATLNPDFSQVETDSAQLDVNNTFSLFYDEKRPFFLDGADYFTTDKFNLVHTRNIADPDFGGKITGKYQQHSYGLLVAEDNNTSFLIPGTQSNDIAILDMKSKVAMGRYKMDVGSRSNVGVLMTSRRGDDYRNELVSIDGTAWLDDNNSMNYQLVRSESRNPLQVQQEFGLAQQQSGNAYFVGLHHETRDVDMYANVKRVDRGFRADLGFISQSNYARAEIGSSRTFYFDADDWFSIAAVGGNWDKTRDLDGNLLEEEWELNGSFEGQMQFYGDYNVLHRKRLYQGQYFDENQLGIWNEFTPFGGLLLAAYVQVGTEIDVENVRLADSLKLEGYLQWQMDQHFNLDTYHIYNSLEDDKGKIIQANLTQAKLTYQFNMRSRLSLILQYTRINRNLDLYVAPEFYSSNEATLTSQLLYSYELNPQTLVYLGYSDNGIQDNLLVPHLTKTDRTLFAKFSYAWQL